MALQAEFSQGMALHSHGELAGAERIYREVLRQHPHHFGALHMLGVIALQTGHAEQAANLIRKAIALNAEVAAAHYNLGKTLTTLGTPKEALASYERAIALKPDYAEAYSNCAGILAALKRPDEALAYYDKAIALRPDFAEAYSNRGAVLNELKRHDEALANYDKAIALRPDYAEAYSNRSAVLNELQRHAEELADCDKAIALRPDYAEAYNNRGNALSGLRRHDEALANYDKAISLKPAYVEAYSNRGNALSARARYNEALANYDKAIALRPDYASAYSKRANALNGLGRNDEALANYDKAIALNPDFAEAYSNRATVLNELKRHAEALADYDRAIALRPDYAHAYRNQSLCLILTGQFERGWRQYQWRKKCGVAARSFPQPLWLGDQDIAGKTLFLWWEQGLGDTIQFCRYGKLAEARGAKVIMSVQEPLLTLLQQSIPTIRFVADEVPAEFDYHCPLLSLPLAFGTALETIPASIPYLKSSVEKSLFWQGKLGEKNKLRVGLVWSGGFRADQPELWPVNRRRNIPLGKLASLKNPDVEFYSLQKGQPAESELTELTRNHWDGPNIVDFTSLLNDFSDTAALIDNLDLVISVDTSTAHLAGAMGKPVWILNRFDTCWRWLLERTDSPWYPTVKLYRQEKAGDWDAVVLRVKADLMRFHADQGS